MIREKDKAVVQETLHWGSEPTYKSLQFHFFSEQGIQSTKNKKAEQLWSVMLITHSHVKFVLHSPFTTDFILSLRIKTIIMFKDI